MALTLGELAERIGGEVDGDGNCIITGIASLTAAKAGDITFLANGRFGKYLDRTAASAVILSSRDRATCPVNALVVENPYASYAHAAQILHPVRRHEGGIHPAAVVAPESFIHESAWIGPRAVVGPAVKIAAHVNIGAGCIIDGAVEIGEYSRLIAAVCIVEHARIGKRALIHPGVVIGGDGFGFANDSGEWVKIPQLGGVIIGDDVEIGANTTIDRGALEDTVLEEGVKLDNHIQIAHNVHIGAHTAIAACTGIAGSTRIGKRCAIGGAVGIGGHLRITDDVHITGMSYVAHSIKNPGLYSSGTPMELNHRWHRNYVRMKQLDDMARRLRSLEKRLEEKYR